MKKYKISIIENSQTYGKQEYNLPDLILSEEISIIIRTYLPDYDGNIDFYKIKDIDGFYKNIRAYQKKVFNNFEISLNTIKGIIFNNGEKNQVLIDLCNELFNTIKSQYNEGNTLYSIDNIYDGYTSDNIICKTNTDDITILVNSIYNIIIQNIDNNNIITYLNNDFIGNLFGNNDKNKEYNIISMLSQIITLFEHRDVIRIK